MRPPRFSFIIMFLACVSVLSTESARAGLIIDITGTAGANSIDINFSGTAVTTESIYTGTGGVFGHVIPLMVQDTFEFHTRSSMWEVNDGGNSNLISNAAIQDSNFAVTGSATVTIDGNTRNIDRWFFDDDGASLDDWGFSIDSAFPALSAGLGVSWTGSINVSGVDLNDLNVGTYEVVDNVSNGFANPLTLNISEAVVPEPSSLALLGIGGIALVGYGYRRKRTPVA